MKQIYNKLTSNS